MDAIQEPARALKKHGSTLRGLNARQHFVCWMTTKGLPWMSNLSREDATMARPRKNAADKMSERVMFWMTPIQRKKLDAKARLAGMSVPDYLRLLVEEDVVPDRMRITIDPEIVDNLHKTAIELKAVGNNINQLARATHRGRDISSYFQGIGNELSDVIMRTDQTLSALLEQHPL